MPLYPKHGAPQLQEKEKKIYWKIKNIDIMEEQVMN